VTVRFLADEDLRDSIIQGLRSREPALDMLTTADETSYGVNPS